MFFLRHPRLGRYGQEAEIRPGHPVYERIKAEVLEAEYGDEQEVLESINAFIDNMRQNRLANEAILLECARADENGLGEDAPYRGFASSHSSTFSGALSP